MPDAQNAINQATAALARLGPRPGGDAPALRALASHLDELSRKTSTYSYAIGNVPARMVFEGPAGDRYRTNASHVAQAGTHASEAVESAAKSARDDADNVESAQGTWDRQHHAISLDLKNAKAQLEKRA